MFFFFSFIFSLVLYLLPWPTGQVWASGGTFDAWRSISLRDNRNKGSVVLSMNQQPGIMHHHEKIQTNLAFSAATGLADRKFRLYSMMPVRELSDTFTPHLCSFLSFPVSQNMVSILLLPFFSLLCFYCYDLFNH